MRPARRRAVGSISSARRSRRSWSTAAIGSSVSASRPRPGAGGPLRPSPSRWRRRCAGGEGRRGRAARRCKASGSGHRATSTSGQVLSSRNARNLPSWSRSSRQDALGRARDAGRGGNDVQVATQAEFKLGAGKPYKSLLGVLTPASVVGSSSTAGRAARGAAARARSVTWSPRRGALPVRLLRLHGATRAAPRGGARPARTRQGRQDQPLQAYGRTRLTSSIWLRAIDDDDQLATELIDRAVFEALGADLRVAVNLSDVEAVIIGRWSEFASGRAWPSGSTAMYPDLFNDDRPPAVRVAASAI